MGVISFDLIEWLLDKAGKKRVGERNGKRERESEKQSEGERERAEGRLAKLFHQKPGATHLSIPPPHPC